MRTKTSYAAAVAAAIAAVVFSAVFRPTSARAVTIDWVTVGDPGNTGGYDEFGRGPFGAVADSFQIMKFEFTNQQYTEFLNSVDPNGTNPNSVYSSLRESSPGVLNPRGGISFTSGASPGSKYAVTSNMGDKPVNLVSWWNAARVANWVMNGATNSSSTETGAYTLNNAISGPAPAVNPGATVFLPTENQWYKAAYYKGGSTNAGYWTYATQSNLNPTAVQATTAGTGTSGGVSPVTSGNFANFNSGASWNGQTGNVTTVGTNGVPSAYGAFDLTGNVSEWTGTSPSNLDSKLVRGGGWGSPAGFSSDSSSRTNALAAFEGADLGFRLAAPVPEPSTWVMGAGGLACVAWRSIRRRRAR